MIGWQSHGTHHSWHKINAIYAPILLGGEEKQVISKPSLIQRKKIFKKLNKFLFKIQQ